VPFERLFIPTELRRHESTFDLAAGSECPATGIYVVSHHDPEHAPPHEVLIVAPFIFPKCKICADVRFSLMRLPVEVIHENQFLRGQSKRIAAKSRAL
jgi:hypothetical protein